ncbi:hypothetical protein EZBTHKR_2588 [Elizabethkingia anophelis]|nr:hypothetical protein EZBTHKR_2588 [Elizabethkingia anophelis]
MEEILLITLIPFTVCISISIFRSMFVLLLILSNILTMSSLKTLSFWSVSILTALFWA